MLSPVTKKISDHSTDNTFEFTFHCDLCGKEWQSTLLQFSNKLEALNKSALAMLWQSEHDAAYERANQEAVRQFNRCPKCGKIVCNECFILDADPNKRDLCKECTN